MIEHAFRGTEVTPGWCTQCGGAPFMHAHPAAECRPETCGGIDYDPCGAGLLPVSAFRAEGVGNEAATD